MVKRRDIIRLLEQNGFENKGGANHDRFVDQAGHRTTVPRHREIRDRTFKDILKQAGLAGLINANNEGRK